MLWLILIVAVAFSGVMIAGSIEADRSGPCVTPQVSGPPEVRVLSGFSRHLDEVVESQSRISESARFRGSQITTQLGRSFDRLSSRGELTAVIKDELTAVAETGLDQLLLQASDMNDTYLSLARGAHPKLTP